MSWIRAAAMASVVGATCVACGGSRDDGPLAASARATTAGASTLSTTVGRVVSTGLVSLANPTGHPITLDGVHLDGGRGGIELVGAGVQRSPPEGAIGLDYGFPPPHVTAIAPLAGAVVAPHERDVAVVVGARATRPGVDSFQWIRVDYHTDPGSRYRASFPIGVEICAARHAVKHIDCPPAVLPGG